jgi:predicted adenylyl cyclase CyaB
MPANIEIKARVHDLDAIRARAARLSEGPEQVIPQTDTFFHTSNGRLKLRELTSGVAQLIYYDRSDQSGPRRSDYSIFETPDPRALKLVLSAALGVRGVVSKVRRLYMIGQTRVHLDEVEGLGTFMELEVVLRPGQTDDEGRQIAEGLLLALGVDRGDLLESAYIDQLQRAA